MQKLVPRRRRIDRHSIKNMLPWHDRPVPPAPPAPLNVTEVRVSSGDPFRCIWTFDQDINDPTTDVLAFRAGQPGRAWTRVASNALAIDYDTTVEGGVVWDVPAGAGGVLSVEGMPLQAGTGIVVE